MKIKAHDTLNDPRSQHCPEQQYTVPGATYPYGVVVKVENAVQIAVVSSSFNSYKN